MNDDDCAPPSHHGVVPDGATQVTIGGATLAMRTGVVRMFNEHGVVSSNDPNTAPFGPLLAIVHISSIDGTPFPEEVRAESLWIAHEHCIWTSAIDENERGGDTLKVTMRDPGPLWEPGLQLAVVVALRDAAGHVTYLRDERARIECIW
jgi:hypothetical protein